MNEHTIRELKSAYALLEEEHQTVLALLQRLLFANPTMTDLELKDEVESTLNAIHSAPLTAPAEARSSSHPVPCSHDFPDGDTECSTCGADRDEYLSSLPKYQPPPKREVPSADQPRSMPTGVPPGGVKRGAYETDVATLRKELRAMKTSRDRARSEAQNTRQTLGRCALTINQLKTKLEALTPKPPSLETVEHRQYMKTLKKQLTQLKSAHEAPGAEPDGFYNYTPDTCPIAVEHGVAEVPCSECGYVNPNKAWMPRSWK